MRRNRLLALALSALSDGAVVIENIDVFFLDLDILITSRSYYVSLTF
jgi:hypothetical protein